MKAALIQFCPAFGEKRKNLDKIKNDAGNIDADILVFPELCTTGYFFQNREEVAEAAETFGGDSVSEMQQIAADKNKIICFGFPEKDGDKLYNSCALLFPDNSLSALYRKTHLFYKEKLCFDPGDTGFFVVRDEKRNVNIGPMICYDWRFPEASRALGLKGADIIVCPSNLVTDVWHLAMPARALENKLYLAVTNRTGTENRGGEEVFFKGMSAVYSYNGQPLCKADMTEESVLTAEIYPMKTRDKSFNEFNDIFKDRRPELYIK